MISFSAIGLKAHPTLSLFFLFFLFIREFFDQVKCDADNQQKFQECPREDHPQNRADNEINQENNQQNIKPVHKSPQ
jgi:hypothetical protein